jgi:HK97 family phage portal protein
MSIKSRITSAWSALTARSSGPGSGAASYGWTGGPMTIDAFGARRAPSPWRLVESYKGLVYSCADGNAAATVRTPLRLYATKTKAQARPRCFHGPVAREVRTRLEKLPWVARSMTGGDDVHEIFEHPWLRALDHPNSEFDRIGLLYYMLLSLDIVGSGYIAPVDGGFGPPLELWPLEPHWTFPVRSSTSALVQKYTYFSKEYLPEQLIRFRRIGLRDAYGPGYSPGLAAFEYGGLEAEWLSVQSQILSIQARPGVIVSPDDDLPMGDPERQKLEGHLNRKFSQGGQGRILVPSAKVKVQPITYPPIDPGGVELSRYDLERIANIFKYPVAYLTGETNLANLQAAHRQHAEQAVEPRCHLLASVLTTEVRKYDDRLFFAFDNCLPEDEESEAKVKDIKIKNGSKLINEARAEDGDEPVAWGDEPWLASTLRQPSEERPKPAVLQAAPGQIPPPDPVDPDDDDKAARALDLASRMLALMEREDGPGGFRGQGRRAGWSADGGADRP